MKQLNRSSIKSFSTFTISTFYVLYSYLYLFPSKVYAGAADDLPPTICGIEVIIQRLLEFALGFAGLATFVMFIFGGYKWLTAGTNEKAVQEARQTFTLSILGMVFIFGGWFILLFIENFTGIEVTIVTIPGC